MSTTTGYNVVSQNEARGEQDLYIEDGDLCDPGEADKLVINDRVRVMARQLSIGTKPPCPTVSEQTDPVSDAIGEYGKWQLLMTFLLSLFSFPVTFVIYSTTFIAAETPFWCARPANLANVSVDLWKAYSQPAGACHIRDLKWSDVSLVDIKGETSLTNASLVQCTAWEFDTTFTTILTEWNLICDNSHLTNLADLLFLTSVGFGGMASGFLSDKFGRKRILFIAQAAQTTIGILTSFVPNLLAYLALRTLVGLVSVTVVATGFVLAVEMVSGRWVTVAGVCNFFPLPVSYVLVSAMSWMLPDWRHLQLAISLPGLLLLPLWFVIPESPRWLLSQGHTKELAVILTKAAEFNGRAVPSSWDKLLSTVQDSNTDKRTAGVLDLYRQPLRKRSLVLIFLWFTITLSYYGLVLNIGNLGGNLHLTSIILGLVEIPSIALSIPILLKMGRRYPIFLSMGIAGLSCITSLIVDYSFKNEWLTIAFVTIGKFSISASNIMIPTYTAELYPTFIRNLGVGTNQMPAGIALMCIPYLWKVGLPMALIGVLSILGGASVLLLPETGVSSKPKTEIKKNSEIAAVTMSNGSFTLTGKRER